MGAVIGVGFAGAAWTGRLLKVYLFDSDYYSQLSRQRYLEKQTIFYQALEEKLRNHYIANVLVGEYDPVDTRLPFQHISEQFRF